MSWDSEFFIRSGGVVHGGARRRDGAERRKEQCCAPSLQGAHGVVASHPLRMRKALGSNPSVSICAGGQEIVCTEGHCHAAEPNRAGRTGPGGHHTGAQNAAPAGFMAARRLSPLSGHARHSWLWPSRIQNTHTHTHTHTRARAHICMRTPWSFYRNPVGRLGPWEVSRRTPSVVAPTGAQPTWVALSSAGACGRRCDRASAALSSACAMPSLFCS